MSKEVPKEWADAMERKGFTHNGRPSVSRLADATTLATETVRRMIHGMGTPEQVKVNEVADALGVSRIELNRWIGIARSVEKSYEPPVDADLMTEDQRDAANRVIQLFVDAQKRAGDGTATSNVIEGPFPGPYDEDLDALPPETDDPPPITGRSSGKAARTKDDKK